RGARSPGQTEQRQHAEEDRSRQRGFPGHRSLSVLPPRPTDPPCARTHANRFCFLNGVLGLTRFYPCRATPVTFGGRETSDSERGADLRPGQTARPGEHSCETIRP